MKSYLFDPLVAVCAVCDKRIGLTQEWTRSVSGIRHALCEPEPVIDGEWVSESICRECGTPCDAGAECSFCLRVTDTRIALDWRCNTHGGACFCSPYVAEPGEPFA